MKEYPEVYAVDFDKTLNLAEKYPQLGEPNKELFRFLIRKRQQGDKVILWTCREDDLLKSAIKYCKNHGLEFDAINDNLPENIERWNNNCRKVFADYYIDDRNRFIKIRKKKKDFMRKDNKDRRLCKKERG